MRRYTLLIAGWLAALLAVIFWFGFRPNDERTQLVLRDSYGRVTSGTKLGVTVGEPWGQADATIRSFFEPRYVLWQTGKHRNDGGDGVRISDTPILTGQSQVSYRDSSWRDGVVTLGLTDGRVVEITWHYPGPFYIDL